ncbi:transglutaminase family protein [Labilibaculum sp. K2S]|uniref:transglutaminase family protein n=1 Tax=Labilibaculum sp. K2S TaxID=3056386 RepID=UPI0025A489A6|nr:transglutaminase family protein [Labilibaculum sp. K2S]MDM8158250.1 transglutaminase family protein [Labilibaculum sp. K2S]
MNKNKLEALLSLLDDPDKEIHKSIEKELIELPVSIISQLEDSWLESKSPLFQERLEMVINKIQFKTVKKELIAWSSNKNPNLIEGAILVNKSYNPNLLIDPIRKSIQKIKDDVSLEINDHLTALEKIKILNHFFYNIYNYQALSPNQPTNWDGDISTVLSQKHGNYIIIAIIYAGIAQELNIPVYGINLPGSVLLCYKDESSVKSNIENTNSILFYINPIDKGTVFGQKDLHHIIKAKNIVNRPQFYKLASNTSMIKRLVQHEINVYKKLNLNSFIPNFKELFRSI